MPALAVAESGECRADAGERHFLFGLTLAVLLDNLGLRLREELLVAKLAADFLEFALDRLGFLLEPLALLAQIDGAGEVEEHGGALDGYLDGLAGHGLPARALGFLDALEARKPP